MQQQQDAPTKRTLALNAETLRNLDSKEIGEDQLERVAGASGLRPTCIPDTDFSCWICSIDDIL